MLITIREPPGAPCSPWWGLIPCDRSAPGGRAYHSCKPFKRELKQQKLYTGLNSRRHAEEETVILFENRRLTNVFDFKYLGHLFQADRDPVHAVEVRAGMAKTTFHRLHEFWASPILDQVTKLRLYRC